MKNSSTVIVTNEEQLAQLVVDLIKGTADETTQVRFETSLAKTAEFTNLLQDAQCMRDRLKEVFKVRP